MSDHSNDPGLVFRTLHDYKEPRTFKAVLSSLVGQDVVGLLFLVFVATANKMTKGHHDPVSDEQPEGESISEAKEGSPVSPLKVVVARSFAILGT